MSEPNDMTINNSSEKERGPVADFFHRIAMPHASITDIAERQKVRFLSSALFVFACLSSVRIVIGFISGSAFDPTETAAFFLVVGLATMLFISWGITKSTYYRIAPFIAITSVTVLLYLIYFSRGDYRASTLLWLIPVLLLTSALVSLRSTFFYAAINIIFLLTIPQFVPVGYDDLVSVISLMISTTGLLVILTLYRERHEALQQLQLNQKNQELQAFSRSLETRVEERTQDLALASEIGRIISQIQDINILLKATVSLIRERFDLYYTQIYIVDSTQNVLVLRAGTGTVGETLIAQHHMLDIDERSTNGRAVFRKEPMIIPDTEKSDFFRPNPALPDTRSELSVPLIVDEEVVGVIDLQSNQVNGLSEENLAAFRVLAGQLAVAIQNARLVREMESTTAFLDSVIDHLPLMLFVKNADDLTYIRFNKRGEEITGITEEEFLGKSDYDFYPREQAATFIAKDREVLASGELLVIDEDPHERMDRQTRYLHTTKVPIYDKQGKPRYLLGIAEDVTEQKTIAVELGDRVKQLAFLNDVGRRIDRSTSIPALLEYVAERIPSAMTFSDVCVAGISLDGQMYGNAKAPTYPRHIVEDLRLDGHSKGTIFIAYTNAMHEFRNEESALIGDIGRRISNFIETQRLIDQTQKRASDLRAVSEIGTVVSSIIQEQELLNTVVELVKEQFDLYHVHVYLMDKLGLNLQLKAGAGEAGRQMVARQIVIPLNREQSMVALSARTRQGVIIADVQKDISYAHNPLLPHTKSELAIPLSVGENDVIGILNIMSQIEGRFTERDLDLFSTLASQVSVTLQNARQSEQTQGALQELSALQRVITGEGWQSFLEEQTKSVKGYIANHQKVEPVEETAVTNGNSSTDVVVPLSIRGTSIGRIGVKNAEDMVDEDRELLDAVSRQVAEALERARLFEESEISRQQTNALYAGSEQVIRANTMGEVLEALANSTALGRMEQASLLFFDRSWDDEEPELIETIAVWERTAESPAVPVGTVYPLKAYPILEVMDRDNPLVIEDAETFEVSENTRALFEQFGVRSAFAFPLVVGDNWIGILTAQSNRPTNFDSSEIKQISSLVSQASVVVQTQRLFDQSEARAEQEQLLRQVSERVYGAVDAEAVLKTAVQEVGRALGLEAFVYLDDSQEKPDTGELRLETETAVNGKSKNGNV